jgi:hypothetical protein
LCCAAVKAINASNKTVCFEIVGYLLEELRDPDNFASFKEDLASANVFIGSLIFIEELAEKVGESVCARASGRVRASVPAAATGVVQGGYITCWHAAVLVSTHCGPGPGGCWLQVKD